MTTSVGGTVCVRGAGVTVSPDTPGAGTAGTASTVSTSYSILYFSIP